MKPMNLNLSSFKKVSSDKDSTTLQHKDGHTITLAHKALPHLQRKALERLPLAEGGTVIATQRTMAQGGEVNNSVDPDNALNQYVPEKGIIGGTIYDGSTDEKFLFGDYCFDIDKARMISNKQPNAEVPVSQKWIDKIKIDPEAAIKSTSTNPVFIAQVHTPNGIKPLLIDGNHRMFKAIKDGKQSIPAYVFTPEQTATLFVAKPEQVMHPADEANAQKFAKGGEVKPKKMAEGGETEIDTKNAGFNPSLMKQPGEYSKLQQESPEETSVKETAAALGVDATPSEGDKPVTEAVPPASNIPQNTVTSMPTNEGEVAQLQQGYGQQQAGLKQSAKVAADIGAAKAVANNAEIAKNQEFAAHADALSKELAGHVDETVQAIKEGKINPNHYMENMSIPSKIATAIGMIAGGAKQGLIGGDNPAVTFIDKQIDRDIAAQQSAKEDQKTILGMYEQKFGKGMESLTMAKATQQNIYAAMLDKAANEQADPQAKAALLMQSGALKNQSAREVQPLIYKQALLKSAMSGGSGDPSALVPHLVPADRQKEVFEEIKDAQNTRKISPQIMMAFERASSRNPAIAAQGQREFEGLINTTVKEKEGTARQAAFESIHKNMTPSGLTAAPGENDAKRRTVMEYLASNSAAPTARGFGIDLSKFPSTTPVNPQQAASGPKKGDTAKNPQTGTRIIFNGTKWVPYNG